MWLLGSLRLSQKVRVVILCATVILCLYQLDIHLSTSKNFFALSDIFSGKANRCSLPHICLKSTNTKQQTRLWNLQTNGLPTWAKRPKTVRSPSLATECLSETLQNVGTTEAATKYLPYRDFGEHPVVVVTKLPDHYDALHNPRCDVPCYIVKDAGWDYRADGFMNMLYIADFSLPDQVQCPGYQRNYQGTIESIVNYPHLYSRVDDQDTPNPDGVGSNERMPCISVCNMNSPAGVAVTLQNNVLLRSDPTLLYAQWHPTFNDFNSVNREVRPRDVVAIISNCEDTNPYSRLKYIEDMRSSTPELQIDIYGKCGEKGLYEGSKHDLLRQYKFVLAFENSAAKDYVTEKFYHALEAGVVPVLYGTPNIRDFQPDPQSIIVADEFESAADLAKYLLLLSKNSKAYIEFHTWRRTGGSDQFKALMDTQAVSSLCRICISLADKWVRRQNPQPLISTDHILIRERNTFYFRVIPGVPRTAMQLYAATYEAFKGYEPVWSCRSNRTECSDILLDAGHNLMFNDHRRLGHDTFKIYSIYPAYSTQENAQRNADAWLNADTKVAALVSGDKLEVIFL